MNFNKTKSVEIKTQLFYMCSVINYQKRVDSWMYETPSICVNYCLFVYKFLGLTGFLIYTKKVTLSHFGDD